MKITDCFISGHYYKVDLGNDTDNRIPLGDPESTYVDQSIISNAANIGAVFYVKCVRCGDRRLINDKTYNDRKNNTYKL